VAGIPLLNTSAINPGLLFAAFGMGGAVRIRLAVRFGLEVFLALLLTLSDTVTAFAFAIARRVSFRHFFHDIFLLIQDS
jgi:hypothetical protein